MRRRWPWLALVTVLGVGAWLLPKFVILPITVAEGYEPLGRPRNHEVAKVVKADQPTFRLDPGQPWRIEFGRGSGWHGLDTAKLDREGGLILHRLRSELEGDVIVLSWQVATAQLPPDAIAKVAHAIEASEVMNLDKSYHANVADGTQWVLWVRQGDRERALYFDNHFPEPIVHFAERFDEIVSGSVGPGLRWRAVPAFRARDHERELWASIR